MKPLPYTDHKSIGAADFYFAINATFRFILARTGMDGLRRYWIDLGTNYFAPVSEGWKSNGLPAIAAYWRAFFDAEPGAVVDIHMNDQTLVVEVKTCPAIHHLRAHGREIIACYCQHCYFINEAIAAPAGFTARVVGGNGACRQTFQLRTACLPPQDLADIQEASC